MKLSIALPELPIEGKWKSITYPQHLEEKNKPQLADAIYVRHDTSEHATVNDGKVLVEDLIKEEKGKAVFGWALSEFKVDGSGYRIIEVTPRAVFQTPEGEMVDVTESVNPDNTKTCFIPTNQMWKKLPNSQFYLEKRADEKQALVLTYMLATKYIISQMKEKGVRAVNKTLIVEFVKKHAKDLDTVKLSNAVIHELKTKQEMFKARAAAAEAAKKQAEEAAAEPAK